MQKVLVQPAVELGDLAGQRRSRDDVGAARERERESVAEREESRGAYFSRAGVGDGKRGVEKRVIDLRELWDREDVLANGRRREQRLGVVSA